MNTLFAYFYHDACNYKTFHEEVIAGELKAEEIDQYLWEGDSFVPSEVGLPDLQPETFTIDDHIWHAIDVIQPTEAEPTCKLKAKVLLMRFRRASKKDWNQGEVFRRKGLM